MKVRRETIWTEVLDGTDEEIADLQHVLTFESDTETRSLFDDVENRFYSGLIPFLETHGFSFEVLDEAPTPNVPVKDATIDPTALQGLELRDYQILATRKTLHYGRGIVQAPTGSGKTAMAAAAIQHYRLYGLVGSVVAITPSVFLMQQMANSFEAFGLGEVIRVGGHHKFPAQRKGRDIGVFVIDSAVNAIQTNRNDSGDFIREADLLILEEAHHTKADTWVLAVEECQAQLRLAYTATVHEDPEKWSYGDLVLMGLTGKIFFELRSKELRTRGFLADPLVTVIKVKTGRIPVWSWHNVYQKGIVGNKVRNSMIISLASSVYEGGNKVMIFVGQKKHGHDLARKIAWMGCDCVFVHGGSAAHLYNARGECLTKHWNVDDIARYVNQNDRCVLITTQVLDEGLDVPAVNVLIMATGMEKYRRTVQRCGRGMRPKPGQNKVFIFDFYDENHPYLKKHSEYRMWTYREEEYEISESLEQTMSVLGCPIVVMRSCLRDL